MVPGLSSIFPSLIWYVLFEISAPCIDSVFISASTSSSSIPRLSSLVQYSIFFWSSSIVSPAMIFVMGYCITIYGMTIY